jgi:hypothetical protein
MIRLLFIIGIGVALGLFLRAQVRSWRFAELRRELFAYWLRLQKNDQVDILYADAFEKRIEKCPAFDQMTEKELNGSFHDLVESHWHTMKATGDYDFTGPRVALQYLFDNRVALRRQMRERMQ